MTLTIRSRYGYFELKRPARFDYLPVVCPHCFGDFVRVNFIVGFPSNLITVNLKSALIFAVD